VHVLLVEGERRLAEHLRQGLAAEGFAVDVVHDGDRALYRVREEEYDAVVLDLVPAGEDVCRRLRAAGVRTPVLALTAKDPGPSTGALDLGADDLLPKPFSFLVFVARLRSLVPPGAPERPAVLVAGDLSLDLVSRTARRGSTEIPLTPREFRLLHFLMRRRGELVPKTEILESVWDAADAGDVNVVEVYVGYLRRKIDQPFGRHAIQTVRGAGYRLAPDGG
jgi:DNA-binding response OmpR family regulator